MLAADILTISVVVYVGPLHPALALCPASTLSNKPGRTALLEPRPVLPHQIQPVHISKAGLQRKCAMHFRKFCKKDLHISKNDPRLCPPGCSLHRLQKCRSQPHRKAKEIRFCFDDHLCLACLTRPLWLLPTAGSYLVYSLFWESLWFLCFAIYFSNILQRKVCNHAVRYSNYIRTCQSAVKAYCAHGLQQCQKQAGLWRKSNQLGREDSRMQALPEVATTKTSWICLIARCANLIKF